MSVQQKVSNKGNILTVGKENAMYHTIQSAVNEALPGDTVLIEDGIYREEVCIPQGGLGEDSRITLKAVGKHAVLTGSNCTSGWKKDAVTDLFILKLAKGYFGNNAQGNYFNPFATRWMAKGFTSNEFFTCGCVYANGNPLAQQWSVEDTAMKDNSWFAVVEAETGDTTLYANFKDIDPTSEENLIEINVRMQCVTAAWNQGFITIDGLNIMHGCGPKTIDFWMTTAEPMYGAVATNGGHHWIIENCDITQCRGVAVDFGNGSGKLELRYGGEPKLYGFHIIRNNRIQNNGTNGIMAYRGAYTEIYGNVLANNNALNTGLASEAYIKDVSGGWGIHIHDNYFYSDQEWSCFPIWLDSECDMCRVSKNIIYCLGNGRGFTDLDYECNSGWNLIDNNILIGVGIALFGSTSTYFVNNLWLDMNKQHSVWPQRGNTAVIGAEGNDGYSRAMRLVEPGTLKLIGKDLSSRFQTFNNFNKMIGNMFLGSGLSNDIATPNFMGLDSLFNSAIDSFSSFSPTGPAGPSEEPAQNKNPIYGEMKLNRSVDEKTGEFVANPDYSGGCWKGLLPKASAEEIEAATKYKGILAWIPVDEENAKLLQRQLQSGDKYSTFGNECDYNVYYAGAQKISNPAYGAAHGYVADEHSAVSPMGNYRIMASPDSFELEIDVDGTFEDVKLSTITGAALGASACYCQAAEKYVANYHVEDYYPDDIDIDFFGTKRDGMTTAVGPFADLKTGKNKFICWPKRK